MFRTKKYTEKEIVEGCVRNERRFQEMLYKQHFRAMMAMCRKHTQDQAIAMDIINIGFLKVFQKIDSFEFRGSLEGWIRRIIYHALSDHFRKNSKYLQFLVFEERDLKVEAQPLNDLYLNDVLKVVDLLSPATQKVFRLYAIEGLTHPEIARELNISVGTSKWHLSNAREKLKVLLQNKNYKNHVG